MGWTGRAWPVRFTVTYAGTVHELEFHDPGTEVLMGCAARGDWYGLIPTRLDDPGPLLWMMLEPDCPLDFTRLWVIATKVLESVFGQPWFVAMRLAQAAETMWLPWSGWALSHGINPRECPPDLLLGALYQWSREGVTDAKQLAKLDRSIFNPPADWAHITASTGRAPWDEAEAMAGWGAALATTTRPALPGSASDQVRARMVSAARSTA